ncbi:MAG: glycosyltransferase family 4 protein [Candidatus Thorarchaeota archaeon]
MSDSDIRLLMYSPLSLRMGAGGDRWLVEVAPRLKRRGILPTVFATDFIAKSYRANPTNWFVKQIVDAEIRYKEVPSSRISNQVDAPVMRANSLRELSGEMTQHDVTYFMNAYAFQDISTWLAMRMAGQPPVISAQHATMFQDSRLHNAYMYSVARNMLRAFDAYHVLNREDYATYARWGLSPAYLIPNGVDTKRFTPAPSKDDSQFTVLFAGRLDYQKGVDTIIDALRYLEHEKKNGIVYKICGTGPMRADVERFADSRPNVHYLGYVPDDELVQLYKNASLFLMPSRRETFGLVAMEAMASGTPVVVTDIPGPRTFVRESFGKMVPPTNAKALAEAIDWFYHLFLLQPQELKTMAKNARDICVKEYDWESVADKLSTMIKKVVTQQK